MKRLLCLGSVMGQMGLYTSQTRVLLNHSPKKQKERYQTRQRVVLGLRLSEMSFFIHTIAQLIYVTGVTLIFKRAKTPHTTNYISDIISPNLGKNMYGKER